MLLYRRPGSGQAEAARAAGNALRKHGVEKVLYLAEGGAVADALEAAHADAAGVVAFNPTKRRVGKTIIRIRP